MVINVYICLQSIFLIRKIINIHASLKIYPFYLENIKEKQGMFTKAIMNLVEVVLEGTSFTVVNVKRSPVTKKLVIHIDDCHSKQLSILKPNKVCGLNSRMIISTVDEYIFLIFLI